MPAAAGSGGRAAAPSRGLKMVKHGSCGPARARSRHSSCGRAPGPARARGAMQQQQPYYDRAVIYLIRVHSAFVELPQEAFRQVPLRGS